MSKTRIDVLNSEQLEQFQNNSYVVVEKGRSSFVEYQDNGWDEADKVYLEVKQTSLVIYGRLPHASGPNYSSQSRHAYAVHAIDLTKEYPVNNWLQWPDGVPEL